MVYEHGDLVDEFKARVRAQHSTPAAMQDLTEKYAAVKQELAAAKEELARQRAANSVLRRVVVELSLELEQAKDELAAASAVTRLPVARDNSGLTGPC